MNRENDVLGNAQFGTSAIEVNKVLRNTYALLAMTLVSSGIMATISSALNMPSFTYLVCIGIAMALMFFVMPKVANSSKGIAMVFVITGLLGFGIGPLLNHYMALQNGGQLIATSLGGTGVIFLALSAYALTSKRDFSFMGGMLMVGFMVAIGLSLVNLFLQIPAMSLMLSAFVILIMSGFILFDTSRIVNGGERNYIMATIGLYMTIFNIFINLLALLGFSSDD
ncbi:MAG: Bax inhibitor-1/YccA family protein [Pseudomonadales bacterium]